MTWPLSRAAVEAAARAGHNWDRTDTQSTWDELDAGYQSRALALAAHILRGALAAWEPSEGQITAGMMGSIGPTSLRAAVLSAIGAAVRTEADE